MKYIIPLLVLLAAFSLGCDKNKTDDSPILASVNSEELSEAEFKLLFSPDEYNQLDAATRKKFIEDWVNLTLLAQAADQEKLSENPALKARIGYASKKVKANALISRKLENIRVSEDELFNYFRIHRAEFDSVLVDYSVQRILQLDKTSAEKLAASIEAGLDFQTAVQTYSLEKLKDNNGLMGFVTKAGADSSWWTACRGLKPKEVSILNQGTNWYVFRIVEERSGNAEANFEDYRELIRRRILAERESEVYRDLLKDLKTKTDEIYYY